MSRVALGLAGSFGVGRTGAPPRARSACIALLAVLAIGSLAASPSESLTGAPLLQYDREAIARGEVWRLATCHVTHWDAKHLAWDLGAFVVLGLACAAWAPRRTLLAVALSLAALPAVAWLALPEMRWYRGLSGVDSVLYGLAGVVALRAARAPGDRLQRVVVALGLLAFAAKVSYEWLSGSAAFATSDAFVPTPLVHMAGLAIGSGVAALPLRRSGPDLALSQR